MTEDKTLADYVELASKRHNGASGRRLAEIAAADDFDVSYNTINRIRKGTYTSEPTTATLRAIAHLAGVAEAEVFKAASAKPPWAEFEKLFLQWRAAFDRLMDLTAQFARMRGSSVIEANRELNAALAIYEKFSRGLADWEPPWVYDTEPTESLKVIGPDGWRGGVVADPSGSGGYLASAARTAPPGYRKGAADENGTDEENQDHENDTPVIPGQP